MAVAKKVKATTQEPVAPKLSKKEKEIAACAERTKALRAALKKADKEAKTAINAAHEATLALSDALADELRATNKVGPKAPKFWMFDESLLDGIHGENSLWGEMYAASDAYFKKNLLGKFEPACDPYVYYPVSTTSSQIFSVHIPEKGHAESKKFASRFSKVIDELAKAGVLTRKGLLAAELIVDVELVYYDYSAEKGLGSLRGRGKVLARNISPEEAIFKAQDILKPEA